MLSLKNIGKKFGNETVLDKLSVNFTSGLNYILGPSGSGKSTLLKIISGMDNAYEGEVLFKGKSLKSFSKSDLNNYYYNSVGFVWQNFQLLNHLSVEDNVKLVLNLSPLSFKEKEDKVRMILKRLGIGNLAKYKVSKLSGGQKQRVAIARALIKDPEIIIADEPTGALDAKSSKIIIDLLKKISKDKLVIVVTHDKGLIDKNANSFLLKGGRLEKTSTTNKITTKVKKEKDSKPSLTFKDAINQALKNIKGLSLKFGLTAVMLILSSFLLVMNLSGTIQMQQNEIYKRLVEERGDDIRNIYLMTNAVAGEKTINQDVRIAFDLLKDEPGIDFMYTGQPMNNLNINMGDIIKDYEPKNSHVVPQVHNLLYGKMPAPDKMEVVVPVTMLDEFGLKPEDVIGKQLSMTGAMALGTHAEVSHNDLTISGVIDTTFYSSVLEDAFIFSLDVLKDFYKQANMDEARIDIKIRATTLDDILPIVDKVQKAGLSAIGDFSSIEDLLKLRKANENQGALLATIFLVLSIVITLALTVINFYLRKNEYAILKINGYSNISLLNLTIFEYILISLLSSIVFLIVSPLLNTICTSLFNMSVSSKESCF